MKDWLPLALLLSCLTPSCIIATDDDDPTPPPAVAREDGLLIVDWSVNGVKDADQCDVGGVDAIHVVVSTSSGELVGEFEQDCEAFATSIELAPGTYVADAVLIGFAGDERTTAVQMNTFDIFGGDELTIAVDFPASSFY